MDAAGRASGEPVGPSGASGRVIGAEVTFMSASVCGADGVGEEVVCSYCSNRIMPEALDSARLVQRKYGSGSVVEHGRVACAACCTAIDRGLIKVCAECGARLWDARRTYCSRTCASCFCSDG
jgi:hypothetical protein